MPKEIEGWNAAQYNKDASFVSAYGEEILAKLAPQSGERILDLGCGEGTLALKLMASGALVVGIDSSADMVKAAQEKGVEAYVKNAANVSYDQEFDAVFSNAALHWVKPPKTVVQGIYYALKSGGRFVAEFGGKGNVETIQRALIYAVSKRGRDGIALNPWYFPTADAYRELLENQGFLVKECALHNRMTPLPTGIEGWLQTFANPFLSTFSSDDANEIIAEVIEMARPSLCNAQGQWFADYVRLRVNAIKL